MCARAYSPGLKPRFDFITQIGVWKQTTLAATYKFFCDNNNFTIYTVYGGSEVHLRLFIQIATNPGDLQWSQISGVVYVYKLYIYNNTCWYQVWYQVWYLLHMLMKKFLFLFFLFLVPSGIHWDNWGVTVNAYIQVLVHMHNTVTQKFDFQPCASNNPRRLCPSPSFLSDGSSYIIMVVVVEQLTGGQLEEW